MNIKNKMRKILFSHLSERKIENFYRAYYRLRYPDELMKRTNYGELNADKTFYIIRPRNDCIEGLLSLFWNVVKNIDYAIDNNYIPVVDFQNYNTQYTINENENVWNYYFTQPTKYSLDEIYHSKHVILSGLEIQWLMKDKFRANYDPEYIEKVHNIVFKYIDFSDEVKIRVGKEMRNLNVEFGNTLGLYLRGTDYIKLKPSGHPVQPNVEQAIEVVDNYLNKYNLSSIFLVTEDGEIYDAIKNKYGNRCITPEFDSYVYGYSGKRYLSNDQHINDLSGDARERGMQYLIKMIILSKCSYLIGGNTNGMWAVNIFAEHAFKDKYIFDLGVYGK